MPAPRTFHLATLGCKVNQYESQALREAWVAQGCAEAMDPARAEVVVINSCAVTAGAVADLRQLVARVRRANPAVRVIVTGCAAQAVRAEVEAIPGVDCIVPQAAKESLLAGLPLANLRSAAAAGKASAPAMNPDAAAEKKNFSVTVHAKSIPASPTAPDSSRAPREPPDAGPDAASGKASARPTKQGSTAREIKISVEGVEGQEGPIPPGEEPEENDGTPSLDLTRVAASPVASSPPIGPATSAEAGNVFPLSRRPEPGPEQEPPSPRPAGLPAAPASASPFPQPSGRGRRAYPAFAVTASPRARAQVKVQDGCSHGCTYCIVPLARGPAVSRAPAEVLAECRRLLAAGWREMVLTGINLRQYRAGKRNFWGLLRYLEENLAPEWAGRARFRLSSLDPGQLGAEALDTLAASRLACPHLHLSLQAGSPGVLSRMGRGHYGPLEVLDFLAGLHRVWRRLGLGADLLTGFPGESAAEFEETRALVAALPLTYAHVFPFSPRPGVPAAGLPGQVDPEEKKARAATLRRLAGAKKAAFLGLLTDLPVLAMVLEDAATGRGTCEYGADCRLAEVPAQAAARTLLRVRPLDLTPSGLRVAPVDPAP